MDEAVIADLKQFIAATVSQATAELVTTEQLRMATDELKRALGRDIRDLRDEVRTIADAHAERLEKVEQRVGGLEERPAA